MPIIFPSNQIATIFGRFLTNLKFSHIETVLDFGRFIHALWERFTDAGMYEVLDYRASLELQDPKGTVATLHKQQHVRYLQDNIIAYQDQAWGDGVILHNYQCSPGTAVDIYRPDQITYILISLRSIKHKNDQDHFDIRWEALNGYTRKQEVWATEISHRTKKLSLELIFPAARPPTYIQGITQQRGRETTVQVDQASQLADGRWHVTWKVSHPIHGVRYMLRWNW